ncbi:hypothetical protein GCM10009744_63910 [Kribbella alba]|uniref:DUF455 family protein n=1 Tax=Kribbella alba TaxID=190197 RepID=A0ABN2FX48_9ACTN
MTTRFDWRVADSRHLLQHLWGIWADTLVCCCQSLVSSSCLDHKPTLSDCARNAARVMALISARYADLRGHDERLGRLWQRSEHYATTLAPADVTKRLLDGVEPVLPTRAANGWLSLYDADTAHTIDTATHEAQRIARVLCADALQTSLAPLDRRWQLPRRPGRPAGFLIEDQVNSGTPTGTPGRFVHGAMFTIELCAAELCAAALALHALEVPTGLLADISKQVYDEMRHFDMLAGLLERHDTKIGDHPIDTLIWDKFLLGETLAERLVIEQRLGEGIGLDGGYALYAKFIAANDYHASQCFDFINADEMTHVRNGNRWIEYLVGGPEQRAALDAKMRERLADHSWPVRHREPINTTDRSLAGFSQVEIEDIQNMARGATP